MAFKLSVGQYYETHSVIHALDARIKLLCATVLMILCFQISDAPQLIAGIAVVVVLLVLAKVPIGRVLASLRPLTVFLIIVSLFNLFVVDTGDVLISAGPITITTDGVWDAVLYTLRCVLAAIISSLILLTTTQHELSEAFDWYLSPLSKIGLPGHEIALVLSLMMRYIPILADEASAIIDAQSMRGGGFDEGGLIRRVRSLVAVLVALLASGLRHADNLTRALDARCYDSKG